MVVVKNKNACREQRLTISLACDATTQPKIAMVIIIRMREVTLQPALLSPQFWMVGLQRFGFGAAVMV